MWLRNGGKNKYRKRNSKNQLQGLSLIHIFSAQESVTTRQRVDISNANVVGQDTTISVGEVYNQLLLTCKTESVENVIESPFDNDTLGTPYNAKQKYMTEYSCDGEGNTSIDAFDAITHGRTTGYGLSLIHI